MTFKEFLLNEELNNLTVELLVEEAFPGCVLKNGIPWVQNTTSRDVIIQALEAILNNKQPISLSDVKGCRKSLEDALKQIKSSKCPEEEINRIVKDKLSNMKTLVKNGMTNLLNDKSMTIDKLKLNLTQLLNRSQEISEQ